MALKPQTFSLGNLVEKHINTAYDTVKLVADNLEDVVLVATSIAQTALVGDNITDVVTVATDIADVNTVAADITSGKIDAAIAAAVSTALDLLATNADVVLTNADVVTSANLLDQFQDIYLGPFASAPVTDGDGDPLTNGMMYWNTATNVLGLYNGAAWTYPQTEASDSATAALASEVAAEAAYDNFDDRYLGAKTADPSTDNDGDALIVGALYFNSTSNNLRAWDGSIWQVLNTATNNDSATTDPTVTDDGTGNYSKGSWWLNTSTTEYFLCLDNSVGAAIWEKVSLIQENANITGRNKVQNQNALSQGESTRSGMESLLGTATSGLDTTTGDFGYLRWGKDRNNVQSHALSDSVRGDFYLSSDTTAAEVATVPAITTDDVSWSFQTTKKKTGLTNRNKAYTCHYNPDMNFSIVGYEGDGVDGHEIPHHLGFVPELTITKNRDDGTHWWPVKSSLFSNDEYLYLNDTNALAAGTVLSIPNDVTNALSDHIYLNTVADNYIQYNFASKSGVCKIGKYIGTGAAGNYVSTEVDGGDAFKPSFVMVKLLSAVGNWSIQDGMRGDNYLLPNSSGAEAASLTHDVDFVDSGFVCTDSGNLVNALNSEYIFMAFAETSIDATKAIADYDYATTPDTLSIANETLISLANGFNANGQVDTQYQFGSGITETYGVGHEDKQYYVYSNKLGVLGVSETRPLSGITRKDADRYGEVSPTDALALHNNSRTTSKHFDYESESGVALASGNYLTSYSYNAFNKISNDIVVDTTAYWRVASAGVSWLQYKHNEKRILKSWRMRDGTDITETPKLFTIEGSDDGLNWTAIDSTYTASDYVSVGASLWGSLQDTSANVTAYMYHRINITANNGDVTYTRIAELEFNTILESDYYLVEEAKMYNSSDVAIERAYLGHFKTDSTGDIIKDSIVNYPIAEQEVSSMKVHKDLTVYGDIINNRMCTAMIKFNGSTSPLLEELNYGNLFLVDIGLGVYEVHVPKEINLDKATWSISTPVTTKNSAISRIDTSLLFISIRNDGGTYADSSGVQVQIFGGKS